MATRKSGNHHQLIHTVLYLPLFTRLLSHHPKKVVDSRSIKVRKQPENPTLNDQQQRRTQLNEGQKISSFPGQYTRSVCIISPLKSRGVSKSSCKTCWLHHPLKQRSMELNYKKLGRDKYPVPMQYQVCKCGRQVNRTPRKTIWQQFSWSLWPGYRLQIFRVLTGWTPKYLTRVTNFCVFFFCFAFRYHLRSSWHFLGGQLVFVGWLCHRLTGLAGWSTPTGVFWCDGEHLFHL